MKSIKNLLTKSILILLAISTFASSSLFSMDNYPEDKMEKPAEEKLVTIICQKDRKEDFIIVPAKVAKLSTYLSIPLIAEVKKPSIEFINPITNELENKDFVEHFVNNYMRPIAEEDVTDSVLYDQLNKESYEQFKKIVVYADFLNIKQLEDAVCKIYNAKFKTKKYLAKFEKDPGELDYFISVLNLESLKKLFKLFLYNSPIFKKVHDSYLNQFDSSMAQDYSSISQDEKTIAIEFRNNTLQIVRLNPDSNQYENASQRFKDVNFQIMSQDRKTIAIKFGKYPGPYSLEIFRLNPKNNQYKNASQRFEDVNFPIMSQDGKTIAIEFGKYTGSLQIFRLNPDSNQYENASQRFEDVNFQQTQMSLDIKTIFLRFYDRNIKDACNPRYTQIVRLNPENNQYENASQKFEYTYPVIISQDGKTIVIKFSGFRNEDTLQIIRLNPKNNQYENASQKFQQAYNAKISQDLKTITIYFKYKTLQIVHLNPENNQYENASHIFRDVNYSKMSPDGKFIAIQFSRFRNEHTLQIFHLNHENNLFVNAPHIIRYLPEIEYVEVSTDGKTIAIKCINNPIFIFHLNPENNLFERKLSPYRFLSRKATISQDWKFIFDLEEQSINILRFNHESNKFEYAYYEYEYRSSYDFPQTSQNGETIAIKFKDDSLKILRFNLDSHKYEFAQIFKNISHHYMSKDGKTIVIKFKDNSLQIYRNDLLQVNSIKQAMFVLLCQSKKDKLDLTDTSKENVQQLLKIFDSFDEQTKKRLAAKYVF